tara:strand:- start:1036 stop:1326 length:291 start_codon:yes stop_codon:yes gene_type:complete
MDFKYTIISVDEAARCMEIVYTADGHQTMHIGARLPFEGENLEDVVMAFAPIALWSEQTRAVVVPTAGTSGTINILNDTPTNAPVVSSITTGTQTL